MCRVATPVLVLALLLHPVAEGLGAASVLCIGADGHVVIEAAEQTCCGCEARPAPAGAPTLEADSCCACLDLPIPGGTGSSGAPAPRKSATTPAAMLPATLPALRPAPTHAGPRAPARPLVDPPRAGTVVLRC